MFEKLEEVERRYETLSSPSRPNGVDRETGRVPEGAREYSELGRWSIFTEGSRNWKRRSREASTSLTAKRTRR